MMEYYLQRIENGEDLDNSEFEKFKEYIIMYKAINFYESKQ